MTRYPLKKKQKIQKSIDFLNAYRIGRKRESRHFKVAIAANNLPWSRLGLTVGKKAGNAVRRNYIKRCLREYFRLNQSRLPETSDIVFTAKPGADHLRYADMLVELRALLQKDDPGPNANA